MFHAQNIHHCVIIMVLWITVAVRDAYNCFFHPHFLVSHSPFLSRTWWAFVIFFMTNPRELMKIFLIKWTSSLWCRWKMSFHPLHLSIRDYVISLIDRFFIESHFGGSLFNDWWEPTFVSSNEWRNEDCVHDARPLLVSHHAMISLN